MDTGNCIGVFLNHSPVKEDGISSGDLHRNPVRIGVGSRYLDQEGTLSLTDCGVILFPLKGLW